MSLDCRWPVLALPLVFAMSPHQIVAPTVGGQLSLRTDRTRYLAVPSLHEPPYLYAFTVIARLENRTTQPVMVKWRCPGDDPDPTPLYSVPSLDPELDSGYTPVQICGGYEPPPVIAVPPGGTRLDTLEITGPHSWDGHTHEPYGTLRGRFRLGYELQDCRGPGQCGEVFSNEFEVQPAK